MNRTLFVCLAALVALGCGAQQKPLEASMQPMKAAQQAEQAEPAVVKEDLFQRDRSGQIEEEDLRRLLESPVFLERKARVGVVPVATDYHPDDEGPPLTEVTGALADALDSSGMFEGVTEVTTDWPSDRGISGLREVAARYRVEYLMLYRHRFVSRKRPNNWAWFYPTVVGLFAAPGRTIEVAGVLEATLFDVKTGTLLFTTYERTHDDVQKNLFQNDRKRREIEQRMLTDVSEALVDQVLGQTGQLAAQRPEALAKGETQGGSDEAAKRAEPDGQPEPGPGPTEPEAETATEADGAE